MGWKRLSAILGGVASMLAILAYFGLQPGSSSHGDDGSSGSFDNAGHDYPVEPTTTRPAVIRTTPTPHIVPTTPSRPIVTRTTVSPTPVRPAASLPRKGTGVVTGPSGNSLKVYSSPSLAAAVVASVPVGSTVAILCTVYGTAATNTSGHTSNLWDRISSGFVADVFIYTGTNDPVAPTC